MTEQKNGHSPHPLDPESPQDRLRADRARDRIELRDHLQRRVPDRRARAAHRHAQRRSRTGSRRHRDQRHRQEPERRCGDARGHRRTAWRGRCHCGRAGERGAVRRLVVELGRHAQARPEGRDLERDALHGQRRTARHPGLASDRRTRFPRRRIRRFRPGQGVLRTRAHRDHHPCDGYAHVSRQERRRQRVLHGRYAPGDRGRRGRPSRATVHERIVR